MSTPRTDGIKGEAYQYKWDCKVVHSEFARQLETELAAEREKVAKLRDALNFALSELAQYGYGPNDASYEKLLKETK